MKAVLRRGKQALRDTFGFLRLMETRNKAVLGWTAVGLRRRENAEVRRLAATLGSRPPALVVTVIPTFRRPDGLRRAVDTALAQTVADHVVIVVDDGAGLPELPADPRLIAVSLEQNTAVAGVVRNVGIRLTSSRYVAFLDDDNEWEPDHLAVALAALQAPGGPDAVYTALRRIRPDGSDMDVLSVPFDRRHAAEEGFLDTNAVVARRTRALRFSRLRRPPQVVPREDWELVFRYSRSRTVVHLPVPTVRYLVNPESYWSTWVD
ncbi:glycosyltransferase family A protein [Kitasatospora sp. MAP5-34]|uniref:glycosyltransferase family A protein n=1 Tax=Kitasatospora sp. MAP5-34 TaxID=3035102 RepID=UPI002476BB76|nr:glycosyltransferase family A protein [Kitasatospora sp. MAP5-34]MDH6576157.1 hypothetical protein [Kitasatospora sp. MAP5-34]